MVSVPGSEGQLGPKSSSGSGRISTQALLQGGETLEKWTQMCGNLFSVVRMSGLCFKHISICIGDMQAVMRSLFLQPTLCVDGLLPLRVCYFDFQFY